MWSELVVVVLKTSCQRPGCWQIFEVFQRQKLVSKAAVETLDIPVLPGAARLDVQHFKLQLLKPRPNDDRREFRTVVAANVIRKTSRDSR